LEFKNYKLNVWDVGGQQTIRSYWRNYFEQTDGLVWVVDCSDARRLLDCKAELEKLLTEEVRALLTYLLCACRRCGESGRLYGYSKLVLSLLWPVICAEIIGRFASGVCKQARSAWCTVT